MSSDDSIGNSDLRFCWNNEMLRTRTTIFVLNPYPNPTLTYKFLNFYSSLHWPSQYPVISDDNLKQKTNFT